MSVALSLTHLRIDLIAHSQIHLGGYQAGERLRNCLANVMLRATCAENPRQAKPDPEHAAHCPVCWMLAAEVEPGVVRRAYSLVPPIPPISVVVPGESFSFTLTLFGDGFRFLPYLVLALPEMGREGVGPGRGQFDLRAIWAVDPLTKQVEPVLSPGDNLVHIPSIPVNWEGVQASSKKALSLLENDNTLLIQFLTPTRLIDEKKLVKTPDFGVFFRRLLNRIDDLGQQFANHAPRNLDEVHYLHTLADQVRLVDSKVEWVDVMGSSSRTQRKTPMGGFIGTTTYRSKDWRTLIPWLILGQGIQVGKLTVKGNGVYEIGLPEIQPYWSGTWVG